MKAEGDFFPDLAFGVLVIALLQDFKLLTRYAQQGYDLQTRVAPAKLDPRSVAFIANVSPAICLLRQDAFQPL